MDSEKKINSFKIKKDRLHDYLLKNYFFNQFFNNFSVLLCMHAKNGIWIITGGARKITVCSITFYGGNSNFCYRYRKNVLEHTVIFQVPRVIIQMPFFACKKCSWYIWYG